MVAEHLTKRMNYKGNSEMVAEHLTKHMDYKAIRFIVVPVA